MKIKKIFFVSIFVLSLLALLITFSGCASSGQTAVTAAAAATNSISKNEILIESNTFKPDSVTIKVGDSIKWINKDSYNHTVTAKNGEFDSGDIAGGAEFSFTFAKEGTYEYLCGIHTFMKGTIIVTK